MSIISKNSHYGPRTITNGLVLALDAGNSKSYPGSGTTWTDLSASGNNGTLVNGVGYNSGNLGSLVFDGVNDYVNLGNILDYTTENFTFNTFFYLNSFTTSTPGQGPQLFWKGSFNTNGYYCAINADGTILFHTNQSGAGQFSYTSPGLIAVGVWNNVSVVRTGPSVKIYINGVDRTNASATHINPTSSTGNFQLGAYDAGFIYSNHRVATFQSYSRALSAAEIQQNFNALKGRFGLT